jgi:hypothetical protein
MIAGFPPTFGDLRRLYRGFQPLFEFHRQSFGEWWVRYLSQVSLRDFTAALNSNDANGAEIRSQLIQRHFYRSATSFYRCFDLFLSFLTLQRQRFPTWANVTGYYCRFYFIQAFLNLLQASWFGSEDSIPRDNLVDPHGRNFFVFHNGTDLVMLTKPELILQLGNENQGSHAIWWAIFGSLGDLADFPQLESLEFVLGDGYFNVERRNEVNYSHEYIRGFPELEWFDADAGQMMNHFNFDHGRPDRDITNIDRFFESVDDENADVADFYGDEAQMLWCSVDCYLRILRALEIDQNFISTEKLAALSNAHISHLLPNIHQGIALSVADALGA